MRPGTTLRAARCVAGLAVLLLAAGCGGGGGGGTPGGPTREEQIAAIVAAAGHVEPIGPESDTTTAIETKVEGDYRNTYEQHDAIANLESVTYLGLNDDLIWPGSLVKGTHAQQFVYEPIAVERGPMTISVSLEGASGVGKLSRLVSSPRLSEVRQGIADMLATALGPGIKVPARADYREEQVTNVSHMNLFVGADVHYGGGSLSTRFDWSSDRKRTKVLVKYTQIYYTVDIDFPTSPAQFFAGSVTPAQVEAAMPAGSRPLYVASVGYGMMAIMCIETDFTKDEMKAALDAAYSGAVDAKVAFGYSAKDVLERSSITSIVYGGSTKGLADIETGYAGFQKVLDASKDYGPDTPGVPIVYKFRHVSDNTLALVSLTSQYTIVKPLQLRQRVQVTANSAYCLKADDEGGGAVEIDRFGIWANAYQRNDPGAAGTPMYAYPGLGIFWYANDSDYVQVDDFGWFPVSGSVVLVFDTEGYDFSIAKVDLIAYARDYDSTSANDEASGLYELLGNQLVYNAPQTIPIRSTNFDFDVSVTFTDATR